MSFQIELAEKLSALIGYPISEEHIHSDSSARSPYIRDLYRHCPLLLMNENGVLMCVLPELDFQLLEEGQILLNNYINSAWFNYGFCLGDATRWNDVYWQPLEATMGIHDMAKISRYLQNLSCRLVLWFSGRRPTESMCSECKICATTCPISKAYIPGSWEYKDQEPDARDELKFALKHRMWREFGFCNFGGLSVHQGGEKYEVYILPSMIEPNKVVLSISMELHYALLYEHILNINWDAYASKLTFIAKRCYTTPQGKMVETVSEIPDGVDPREFCLEYWGLNQTDEDQAIEAPKQADSDKIACVGGGTASIFRWLQHFVSKKK